MKNMFEDLMIVVDEKPVKLNVMGLMLVGGDEVIVITDVPALEIDEGEYELFHLIREEGTVSLQVIESEELYDKLCDIWQERLAEGPTSDS